LYTTHEFFIHRSRTLIAETAKAQYFPIQYGDLLFAASGETFEDIGRSAVNLMHGEAYCGGDIVILRPSPGFDIRFLAYAADSPSARQQKASQGRGTTVKHIYPEQLARVVVAVPSTDEQAGIVRFLERETAGIDALLFEQERLIELLKEKRQAVISHAVTKGVAPDIPMKPSGLPWLGAVPAEWSVGPIKHLIVSIEQGWSPQCESIPAESDDEWGVLKVGCVNGGSFDPDDNKLLPDNLQPVPELGLARGDLLVSRANTRELVGRAAVVERDYPRRLLCDKLYRLRFDPGMVDSQFVAFYLGTRAARGQIELQATGASASMVNISQSAILELPIALPPLNEQRSILDTLRGQLEAIDALMSESTTAIALLRERRTAVISAATTGQIDVRPSVVEAKPARKTYSSGFARQILAAEILTRFHSHPTMGRVKLQKLIHLCEYVGQIEEVHGDYRRQAAGPFDQGLMFGVVKALSGQQWFSERREASRSHYVPLAKAGGHSKYLARWQDRMPAIEKVLQLLGTQTSERCEIVSTLYAAWNDLLIEGRTPSDSEIIREATELWHASKASIASERWSKALDWMRKHNLIPTGFGAHTRRATTAAKDDA
jgi:type I restriction enzyme S subunit